MSHTALPPLPRDYVYLGVKGDFEHSSVGFKAHQWSELSGLRDWGCLIYNVAAYPGIHYCAHKDSEIVKLNLPAPVGPTRFIVWSDGRGEPTKIHASRDTADAEAQRLAAKHPTMVFSVCEIVARYKATVTINKL